MFSTRVLSTAFAALAAFTRFVKADDLPAIEIYGNKFFYSNNGSQFYIKGVAYQADVSNGSDSDSFTDPLADADGCKRDIPYLQELGTNVIRVYAIDTTSDHTECMEALQDAGIYVMSDLSEPSISINRDSPEWNVALYNRYTSVVDALANYTNVLGFFAGNEVTNNASNTDASPFVKAAIRDVKAYLQAQDYRSIPVGYAANDDSDIRLYLADYMNCGNSSINADFYGVNMYEWCGDSSFSESGYEERTQEFANYSAPIFLSEYGCNAVQPRTFTDVQSIYGSDMDDVWSGGIVYMYFEETNNYGLVSIDGSSVSTLTDYANLQSELSSASPTIVESSTYTPSNTDLQECPASTLEYWQASTDLPPTPDEDACNCVYDTLSCVVSSDVDTDSYADLYAYLCAADGVDCGVITGNGSTGVYGDYSMCQDNVKLSYVMNEYFAAQDSSSSACDFSGSASIVSNPSSSGSCAAASGSGATGSASKSSSGSATSGAKSSSTSKTSSSASGTATKKSAGSVSVSVDTVYYKIISSLVASFVMGGAYFVL